MYSVTSTFFQRPVSGEEQNDGSKPDQPVCASFPSKHPLTPLLVAGLAFDKDPSLDSLSLQQTIENDYPMPPYTTDVLDKPDGWVETPQLASESFLLLPHGRQHSGYMLWTGRRCDVISLYEPYSTQQCLTEDGKEVTRVRTIDYESVKPPKPVIDYLTR